MRLTIAKPAIGAFEGDLKDSITTLEAVKSHLGFTGSELRVNSNLTLDVGLQVIVREKDLSDLGKLEKNLSKLGNIPFSIHAPYNYGQPTEWHVADLSKGEEGLANLLKVVGFGDNIGAHSIAVHPNAIREKSALTDPTYTRDARLRYLNNVFNNVMAARSKARKVSIDLENKPFPSTTADNENIMYGIAFAPMEDIQRYTSMGGSITFDTCHYGITMRTINDTLERLKDISDSALRKEGILGYFAEDFIRQPSIHEAILRIGKNVNHIHLNDGSIYQPDEKSGRPDSTKPLPKVGGSQLWWEAYVPGFGELSTNEPVISWLDFYQKDDRRVTLTVEVTEFDRNYKENPRFREATISLGQDILSSVR